jgi:hypothetical protein
MWRDWMFGFLHGPEIVADNDKLRVEIGTLLHERASLLKKIDDQASDLKAIQTVLTDRHLANALLKPKK